MATQIASTPVIKGEEALKIYEQANKEPSKDIEEGIKILAEYFDELMR